MSQNATTGTIVAALGDTLDKVAARSSYRFDFAALQDDDLITVSKAVEFRYPDPAGFDLPPTRFLGLSVTAATVVAIELSPQLAYLDRTDALALSDTIVARAERAGWTPSADQTVTTGREELNLLLADPAGEEQQSWYVANLGRGGASLGLRLRRLHRTGRTGNPDAFLLNLHWRDESLTDRSREIARLLRREDHLPWDRWRPIELSRYVPRVSQLQARDRH